MSVYESLFNYRPREGRKPLEDYLTAGLADILNELHPAEHVSFICEILLQNDVEAVKMWKEAKATQHNQTLRW